MGVSLSSQTLDNSLLMISLIGSLDAPGTIEIEGEFQTLIREHGGRLIVELSELEYMSSYGLRMLLLGAKSMGESGGELHLAAPNPRVMELITLAGYDTMFPVHETIEDARNVLGS